MILDKADEKKTEFERFRRKIVDGSDSNRLLDRNILTGLKDERLSYRAVLVAGMAVSLGGVVCGGGGYIGDGEGGKEVDWIAEEDVDDWARAGINRAEM